jgi:hypothetical protein
VAGAPGSRTREDRTVRLVVPASAGYVVLARLALSAVSRLTPLPPEDVADLKLAITEAATALLGGGDEDSEPRAGGDLEGTLHFSFEVAGDELLVEVGREGGEGLSDGEAEVSRAIIDATVDRWQSSPDGVRLVKRLRRPDE